MMLTTLLLAGLLFGAAGALAILCDRLKDT